MNPSAMMMRLSISNNFRVSAANCVDGSTNHPVVELNPDVLRNDAISSNHNQLRSHLPVYVF